jgi:hypothetical protein
LEHLEHLAPLESQEPSFRAAEPVKTPEHTPLFLASTPAFSPSSSSSSSLVWPIGLACVVGLAIGFGVGYTVGIRDHASVGQATGQRPAAPAPPAAAAPRDFTESPVGTGPAADAKAGNDRLLPTEDLPVVPFSGIVVVRSLPAGARVFVDGRDRGSTPATVTDLGRGEHRIRVVRDGYTAAERRVVLTPAQPSQSLSVPLAKALVAPKPNAGQPAKAAAAEAGPAAPKRGGQPSAEVGALVIESRPAGANVFVDGRAVGRTPLNVPGVNAGDHVIRLELVGHRQWMTSIKVVGDVPNRIGASLEKID